MNSFESTDHIFKTYLILRLSIYHTDSKDPSVLDQILCSVLFYCPPQSKHIIPQRTKYANFAIPELRDETG
jgi:hypothetical protein